MPINNLSKKAVRGFDAVIKKLKQEGRYHELRRDDFFKDALEEYKLREAQSLGQSRGISF